MTPRPCRQCSAPLPRRNNDFCNNACRDAWREKRREARRCAHCEGPLPALFYGALCSPECRERYRLRGVRHPAFTSAVERSKVIGISGAAREAGISRETLARWREMANAPPVPAGGKRPGSGRKKAPEEDRGIGPLPSWCAWCGDPLPKGERYCDDDCRTEDVTEMKRSA